MGKLKRLAGFTYGVATISSAFKCSSYMADYVTSNYSSCLPEIYVFGLNTKSLIELGGIIALFTVGAAAIRSGYKGDD